MQRALVAIASLLTLAFPDLALGDGFSIDLASPSVSSGSNSAMLGPGPVGGPPTIEAPPSSLGLSGGITDEINAVSFGAASPGLVFHFSVDRASVGLAGSVVAEAAAGQAAGNMFATSLTGTNALAVNQRSRGLVPASAPGAPVVPPVDDVDAYDFVYDGAADLISYALETGHPRMGTSVGCGGDIFLVGTLLFGYPALGLGSCLDDVDGFEVDTVSGTFYYSLAPGSPSLAPGSPIIGCAAGCGPADIFAKTGASPATLFAPASALGLLPSDDVDALALADAEIPSVPALGALGLPCAWGAMLLGSLPTSVRRGRRRARAAGALPCWPRERGSPGIGNPVAARADGRHSEARPGHLPPDRSNNRSSTLHRCRCSGPSHGGQPRWKMRSCKALITIGVLALCAGGAQANETEGLTGRDWDDSHMRTRHRPATALSGKETSIALEIATEGVRILPASQSHSWRTGPPVGSTAPSASSTRTSLDRLRTRRTLSDPRPTSRRSQSQPTSATH